MEYSEALLESDFWTPPWRREPRPSLPLKEANNRWKKTTDVLLVHDVAQEQDWLYNNEDCKMNSG